MLYRIATVDWSRCAGIAEMLTLTYPAEFPADGPTVKAHLAAFRRRLERRFGRLPAAWKLEFQRRGAPHFHLLLYRPVAIGWRAFHAWCSKAWYEVVGSGDPRHERAGVGLDREVFSRAGSAASRIAFYFAKHAGPGRSSSKAWQNEVPAWFGSPGRFWGLWNVTHTEQRAAISDRDAVQLRRIIRGLHRSRQGRYGVRQSGTPRSEVYCWSLVHQPVRVLVQWLRQQQQPEAVWVHRVTGERRTHPPGRPRPLP